MIKSKLKYAVAAAVVATGVTLFQLAAFADVSGTLLPTANGNYTQWTPSTGTNHAALVDESTCNGNTDYVSTNTVNNRDSYTVDLSSIPNGAVITQIDVAPCASKNSSGGSNSTLKVFYRYNGVNSADAGSYSLSNSPPVQKTGTSFAGLNIVKDVNSALEIGAVLTAGTKGARLSRLSATITYTVPPAAPSNLTAVQLTSGNVKTNSSLHWTDNSSNETGFTIERSDDGGVTYNFLKSVGANVTTSNDLNLAEGVYYYRVYASNVAGNSGNSNVSSVDLRRPNGTPSDLVVTPFVADTSTFANISWVDHATNESSYVLERSADDINFFSVKSLPANTTQTFDFPSSGTYYYRVKASNVIGDSDYSNEGSIVIP